MRADRLISLLLLLQTRGRMPAHELARRLEVSVRTVYRDLDALSAAGIPVYAERGPGGGCALEESYRTTLTGLTEAEVAALVAGLTVSAATDLGMGQALKAAWLKLSAALTAQQQRNAEHVRQRVYLDEAAWFQPAEPLPHLPAIQEAVWQDRRLQLTYRRGDGTWVERRVDPYGLVAKAGIWYLAAAAGGEVRVYRVSRVLAAEVTDEQFERPVGFDLGAFWARWQAEFQGTLSHYRVTVRMAPEAIPILPLVLGEGVQTRLAQAGPPDAAGWITLELAFDSLEVACGRLLGLGTLVEALAPPELRAAMREWTMAVGRLYGE